MAGYVYVILLAYYGWYKIKHFNTEITEKTVNISLLIPFRDEEKHLPRLIESLRNQTKLPFEILFIDDHSCDRSINIVQDAVKEIPGIVIMQNEEGRIGKKAALTTGLKAAKGEWILQTDADCILPEKWIETYNSFIIKNSEALMISAPVQYSDRRTFLSWFYELDFMSLVYTGGGFIGAGKAVFCNAANMAYRREEVIKLNDPYFSATPSGDDVFLLQQLFEKNNRGIYFLKSREVIVKTEAPSSFSNFIKQRIRWGAKAKFYKHRFARTISLLVFGVNFVVVLLWILSLSNFINWELVLVYTLVKVLVDSLLLITALIFFRRQVLITFLLPAIILYPIYIIYTVTTGLIKPFEWKI